MQHDDWLDPTRDRLAEWARWLRTSSSPIGGSITVRYQPRIIDPVHDALPADNQTAEQMDRILCQVRQANALVYSVLFAYYYHHDKSERDLAADLRVSRNRISQMRLQGEAMVEALWRAWQSGAVVRAQQ
jgi:hypothetical protein